MHHAAAHALEGVGAFFEALLRHARPKMAESIGTCHMALALTARLMRSSPVRCEALWRSEQFTAFLVDVTARLSTTTPKL